MLRSCLVTLAILFASENSSSAQSPKLEVTVIAGKHDEQNVPVTVPMEVPMALAKSHYARLKSANNDHPLIGQWTAPGLLTENVHAKNKALIRRDLHFILPELKAGTTLTLTLEPLTATDPSKEFRFKEVDGAYTDLWRGTQPIFRYVHRAYDNSSEANREKTYKVFHHLFDPTGTRIVTNGGQSDPGSEGKKLLYPHHRGLMFAFNKITYGNGKKADVWHAKPKDTHQSHHETLSEEAGQVLGQHRVAIDWHGPDQEVFAKEEREMTVYAIDGGTLIEFASLLKTTDGKVRLDGDPQHAGFQFRASNDVADKTAKQTYYLRPDGKDKPGATRNWDPKNKGPINLPWDAMSFVLGGKRFTVAYIDNSKNPGEKRYSERDYGRFGCYFEYDLTADHPLLVNYRVWLQNGAMTGEQVEAIRTSFVDPPRVAVNEPRTK